MSLEKIAHKTLLNLNPETAHKIGIYAIKHKLFAPGEYKSKTPVNLFGIKINNPLGIAAGFDKYAETQNNIKSFGFGWIELGSFTFEGGQGNPKPRLFRLPDGNLLNRMGLNSLTAYETMEKLSKESQENFAVSIAKTHNPEILGDKAIRDIKHSYKILNQYGIYTAINISCPNTKEGKTFEEPESCKDLVSALNEIPKKKPVVFKFSPNIPTNKLEKLIEITDCIADGYEAVNTLPINYNGVQKGGESGPALNELATETIFKIRRLTEKPIIGVGGISTGRDAYKMKKAGANYFLAFTGFVYPHPKNPNAGPRFAHKVNKELQELILKNP